MASKLLTTKEYVDHILFRSIFGSMHYDSQGATDQQITISSTPTQIIIPNCLVSMNGVNALPAQGTYTVPNTGYYYVEYTIVLTTTGTEQITLGNPPARVNVSLNNSGNIDLMSQSFHIVDEGKTLYVHHHATIFLEANNTIAINVSGNVSPSNPLVINQFSFSIST